MTETVRPRVAVLGGGSFGTVIANLAAGNGCESTLWLRDADLVADMSATRENTRYLPGFRLADGLRFSNDLAEAVAGADLVFVAIPSKAFRQVVQTVKPHLQPGQMLVSMTKGIEAGTFAMMSQILREEVPGGRIGVLSGPNLAKEIAACMPAGTVIASIDPEVRATVHTALACPYFRVFANTDIYGVELGGALKNIYAIATGMAVAQKVGENSRSMLLTRALAEMSRFAVQMGGNPLTFLGLSGVGDLFATCSSPLSRNYQVGFALGSGKKLADIVADLEQTAEGINTILQVRQQADRLGVYMPIVAGLYEIIFNDKPIFEVAAAMMTSGQRSDVEFVLPNR
ncbi:glycerol 3-phosphate dehydrogenase (NAD(P)+) [Fluviicoccus keumensis]|uniref:Glycerol-3-phosphate dehydrogenase [NAD(P)+] n=1 Tax=Fluviicoccus keumensis TaxID=1435465 RepID=A0A4Q7YIU9_9GAMM|nr:glycerol 3-phosphate dehydrogenase (NAD(P)+) [Fluviicoccus keumensis]